MISVNNKTRNVLLAIGFVFVVFLLWYFSAIVTYILISLVLSFIGKPLVRWLSSIKIRNIGIRKGTAAFITLIILWVLLIAFFRFIIPLLVSELNTFSQIDFAQVLDSIGDPIIKFMQSYSKKSAGLENQSFFDLIAENISSRIDLSQLSNLVGLLAGTIGQILIGCFSVSFAITLKMV